MNQAKTLRLILGDQLNHAHSWFQSVDDSVVYVMMELHQEATYAKHHIQKLIGFFAAMRAFSEAKQAAGHTFIYQPIDHANSTFSLSENIRWMIEAHTIERFEYQLPDEWRLDTQLKDLAKALPIPSVAVDTAHFLSEREEVAALFKGKKTCLMETFYRKMRKKYNLLMEGDQPYSGQWNYDADNRKKLPKTVEVPRPLTFEKDLSHIHQQIDAQGIAYIGRVDAAAFLWPTTREEGIEMLDFFVKSLLPQFGDFQDAMTPKDWSLFHARLSFVMNNKLLHPLEVVESAIREWERDPSKIPFAALEGFVRQIVGWREYMRGIYWAEMPAFANMNFFQNERPLPKWYWTGQTKMHCLSHAIDQSLEYAYAHHIQRLMITGAFALLAGTHPDEVDAWYLGIYIDAIEWVEITNTRGMSQFADGGIVGTKPYVGSANYIQKMSHYCSSCHYDYKKKTGPNACPWNSMYWNFHAVHRPLLEKNPRIGMVYRLWDKMETKDQNALLDQAQWYITHVDDL